MAQLPIPRQVFDDNGDPLVGATLTIYDANTTTPTAIYTDAALSVSCTNPTSGGDVSDAGGWFPQIYAAEGTVVDVTLKNSAGTTVQTWTDVTFVGADTGDFSRTVTGSGRIKITGSAGAVQIQAGDPSPDNSGGTLTVEGWAGTQLDTLTLDAASASATGYVKPFGKKISETVYTQATAISAGSSVDIALPNSPTGVIGWRVKVWFTMSASGSIQGRLSYDGGATYKSGASDYGYARLRSDSAAGYIAQAVAALSLMQFSDALYSVANRPAYMEMMILTPNSGSDDTVVIGDICGLESAGVMPARGTFTGYGRQAYGRATHVRVLASFAAGYYTVETIYGLGET